MTAARLVVAAAVVAIAVVALEPWNRDPPRAVAWRDLTDAVAPLQPVRPASGAFASAADLRRFLRANAPGDGPRLPRIDYRRERAVVVASGPRSSSGYDVQVVGVTRSGNQTVVAVRETAPVLGDQVEPRVTYPYRLLAITTTDEAIGFRWLGP